MFKHIDAFIALPGGLGTLKEIFHISFWAQLHIHHKPIVLLNVNGFMINCCLFLIKLWNRNFLNLHFHTHTLTYDCGSHIGLLHYLCSFVKGNN